MAGWIHLFIYLCVVLSGGGFGADPGLTGVGLSLNVGCMIPLDAAESKDREDPGHLWTLVSASYGQMDLYVLNH